jgi:hypothetical protein
MTCEIRRPGSDRWESAADLGGAVPAADVVGALVRYRTGSAPVVCRVTGLSDPDPETGARYLLMEFNTTAE